MDFVDGNVQVFQVIGAGCEDGIFVQFEGRGFCWEYVVVVDELDELYFEVWVGAKGWFGCNWGSKK